MQLKLLLGYVTSGSIIIVNIGPDVNVEEIEDAVIESFSESLGLHSKDIEIISTDTESGLVVFEIKSSSHGRSKSNSKIDW